MHSTYVKIKITSHFFYPLYEWKTLEKKLNQHSIFYVFFWLFGCGESLNMCVFLCFLFPCFCKFFFLTHTKKMYRSAAPNEHFN